MTTVLLIGSGGSLSNALSIHLRSRGYNVIESRRSGGTDGTILDIRSAQSVSDVLQSLKPEYVISLAATFCGDFDESVAINVTGAHHLLASVAKYLPKTRVLLCGSAAEYGVVLPDENPVTEGQPVRPVSIYGLTKSWQTELGIMMARGGADVVIARIFNLEGRGISDRLFVGRIDKQIAEIMAGERFRIEVGSLDAVRDYITVEQASVQILAILESGKRGRVYHVATGEPIKMRDFLRRRLERVGLSLDLVDEHSDLSNRSGYDVPLIYADISNTLGLLTLDKNEKN